MHYGLRTCLCEHNIDYSIGIGHGCLLHFLLVLLSRLIDFPLSFLLSYCLSLGRVGTGVALSLLGLLRLGRGSKRSQAVRHRRDDTLGRLLVGAGGDIDVDLELGEDIVVVRCA